MRSAGSWCAAAIGACAVFGAVAHAQTSRGDPTDVQSRLGVGLHFDLPNTWETSLQYRIRHVDNVAQYRGSYLTGEAKFKPLSAVALLGSYRLAAVNNGKFHRYAVGAEVTREMGPTDLALRGLLQYQKQNFTDNDEQSSDEDVYVRTRLELKHAVGERVDVYMSTEPYLKRGNWAVDNWRNTLGTKVEYAKGKKLDLFYIYRPDYGKPTYNRTFHIIGLDFDFDFKVGGKSKDQVPKNAR